MIELLLVVLIAVISVSVYTYAYYILKFRDDTKHCPPCEPCPLPVPCPTDAQSAQASPPPTSEVLAPVAASGDDTDADAAPQPNDNEPTPCPANWDPVCAEGITYGNSCKATQAGNNTWKQGKCQPHHGSDSVDIALSPPESGTSDDTPYASDEQDNYNSNSEVGYGDDSDAGIGHSKKQCRIMCNECRARKYDHCDEAYGEECKKCNELKELNDTPINSDKSCIDKINNIWRDNLGWVPSEGVLDHQLQYCKSPEISDRQLERALVQRFERMKRGEEVNWTTIQNDDN